MEQNVNYKMLFSNLFREKPFKIENYALKLSLEWGENYEKEISARLLKKFPNLSKEQLEKYESLCKNIKQDCWNCIDYDGNQISSKELVEAIKKVFSKYTWINKSNQNSLQSQFSYYLWKDGILK